jgi:hypothetical protein
LTSSGFSFSLQTQGAETGRQVIDSVFGANLTLFDGIQVQSRLVDFDPEARLSNVTYQGKHYTITKQAEVSAG